MIYPDYFDNNEIEEKIIDLYRELEDFILNDIAGRLIKNSRITATADRLILRLQQMGESRENIMQKLQEITKLSRSELRMLLQDAVLTSWEDEKPFYDSLGTLVSNPLENVEIIRIMDAQYKKSLGELSNLTRTTMEQSQSDLINMLSEMDMQIAFGVKSPTAAVCEILDRYAGQGIEVLYPTGTKRTLEAAVRCCITTSTMQMTGQITAQYIAQYGIEYVCTSAHIGARAQGEGQPELAGHDNWQGRIFKIAGSEPGFPNLLESTGYNIDINTGVGKTENLLGLYGYNCKHSAKPCRKDYENPWRDKDGNLIIGGEKIDSEKNRKAYEISQKARYMERSIRETKRKLLMKETEINRVAETDVKDILQPEYDKLAYRLRMQNKQYNEFCKANGLKKEYDRTKKIGFGRKQSAKANGAATRYQNKHDSMDSSIKTEDTTVSMNDYMGGSKRFTGSNRIFENKTPLEKCNIAKDLTEKYVSRESKWKGIVKVDDEQCRASGIAGRKDWSCTILVHSNTQARTYIHEMLHSRSASHTNPLTYRMHRKIEEASTELLARQICINENITFTYSYRKEVYALQRINNIVQIEENDLLFARRLYSKDLEVRLIWLKNRCDRYINGHPDKKEEVYSLLDTLKGL